MPERIPPRSGAAFVLRKGQMLRVIDPTGEQVSDLLAFSQADVAEAISSGRSLDYAGRLFLSTGDVIYSNRSRPMLRIVEDTVGRHDFTLTPCSVDTFRIIYGDTEPHHGCQGNFERVLGPYGISGDRIPVAFNIFMNVAVDGETGAIRVDPPRSKAGDYICFAAEMDLVVALTACSAPQSNNGSFKPIDYVIEWLESPTTMGAGSGAQPADPTPGQKPPTDPQSKEKMMAPSTGASGASAGEQGSDATPVQKPATDPQSKDKNEGVGAQ